MNSVDGAAREVVTSALALVAGEQLVLIYDRGRAPVGEALARVAKSVGATAVAFVLDDFGPRPVRKLPAEVRAALERAQASVFFASMEPGEMPARMEIVYQVARIGLRHAHIVGLDTESFVTGLGGERGRMEALARVLMRRVEHARRIEARGPNGTRLDVTLSAKHRWAAHTGNIAPGSWVNLPAGEMLTAPESVDGVYVCDGALGEHFGVRAGLLDRTPVRFEMRAGITTKVTCSDTALVKDVEAALAAGANANRVGGVTFGINTAITQPSGKIMLDQNRPGMHLAFGDSLGAETGAAWSARSVFGATSTKLDVTVDGTPLLAAGNYVRDVMDESERERTSQPPKR